jgi:tRNA 2-thiouridine synthesizing protein A
VSAGTVGPPAEEGAPPQVVDARGLRCHLPVIRLAQHAAQAGPGALIEVWATDPAASADIPAWCRLRGQDYLGARVAGDHTAYAVRLVAAPDTDA